MRRWTEWTGSQRRDASSSDAVRRLKTFQFWFWVISERSFEWWWGGLDRERKREGTGSEMNRYTVFSFSKSTASETANVSPSIRFLSDSPHLSTCVRCADPSHPSSPLSQLSAAVQLARYPSFLRHLLGSTSCSVGSHRH